MDELRATLNPAFRFVVEIDGVRQAVFTECTLPIVEWDVLEVKEGGLNGYTHQLPAMRKQARMTLKNGIGTDDLLKWCVEGMKENFERKAITVKLFNVAHEPLLSWHIAGAWPFKWSAPALKSNESALAIQTLEIACGEITVEAAG